MLSEITGFISGIFKPAAKLIDDVHTSEEEKLQLRNTLVELENNIREKQIELASKNMDLEHKLLELKMKIVNSETNSDSIVAKNWRPATMITFVAIIVLHATGIHEIEDKFIEHFTDLVEIGLGGYIAGRTIEKAAPAIAKSIFTVKK